MAYLTHTLDRANLGNAKTDTLEEDLGLVGNQFSLLLILFYIPYSLMNIPFTLLAKRFNPSIVIPSIMIGWGTMAMCAAASRNFGGLLAVRILMGCVEAAFFPCAIFYCSFFYTRRQLSFRTSVFGMMGFIAGAISGLIAWSVFQWDKALRGWQYLFLIEGAMTVGIGIILFLVLPRSIEKSRWFSVEEKKLARQRLEEDSQDFDKNYRWDDVRTEARDWTTWVFTLMPLLYGVGVASSSNFLPVSSSSCTYRESHVLTQKDHRQAYRNPAGQVQSLHCWPQPHGSSHPAAHNLGFRSSAAARVHRRRNALRFVSRVDFACDLESRGACRNRIFPHLPDNLRNVHAGHPDPRVGGLEHNYHDRSRFSSRSQLHGAELGRNRQFIGLSGAGCAHLQACAHHCGVLPGGFHGCLPGTAGAFSAREQEA